MYRYILLLVVLLPVAAFGADVDLQRSTGTQVVTDDDSFVAVELHEPKLDAQNDWRDDILTITHNLSPDVDMEIQAVLVDDHGRFSLTPSGTTIAFGGSQTFKIDDADTSPGSFTITIGLAVEFMATTKTGFNTMERTVEVVVS